MSKEGKRDREEEDEDEEKVDDDEEDEDDEEDDDEVDDLPVALTCLFLSPSFADVVPLFLQPPQDMNIGECCIH